MSDALRSQDWGVVMLEILVVVAGIFLGLRTDAWNQARLDRIEEAALLQRLEVDLDETLVLLRAEESQLEEWFRNTRALAFALERGEGGRSAADENRDGFLASTRVLIGRAQLATIAEMVSGGLLSLIRDPDIRTAIAASEGLTESRRLQLQVLARQQQVLAETIRQYYWMTEDTEGSWGRVEFDWAEASQSRELHRALTQAAENIQVNLLWLREVMAEMSSLQVLLRAPSADAGRAS